MGRVQSEDQGVTHQVGPLSIDVPRAAGYFGGVGIATAVGLVDPVLGVFIAAVPFLKMLNRPEAPRVARAVGQFLDGMAKPVGGDSEGTITLADPGKLPRPVRRATAGRAGAPRRRRS